MDTNQKGFFSYYGYFVILVVLAAIVAAFFAVGSPKEQRLRKADMQRMNDLSMIQSHIGEYFTTKSKLPAKLADLNDAFRGIEIPTDPETKQEYGYQAKGETTFELCADFHLPWNAEEDRGWSGERGITVSSPYYGGYGPQGNTWKHEAGRQCFERTIDKDYFKPPRPLPM